MKIEKFFVSFIAVLSLITVFSACQGGTGAHFYLTVSRPPQSIVDGYSKNLSSVKTRGSELEVRAVIYSEAGVQRATGEAIFEDGKNEVKLLIDNINEEKSVYAYIEIGFNEGDSFSSIYSGCSDLFDISKGQTIPVTIIAKTNDVYSFVMKYRKYFNSDKVYGDEHRYLISVKKSGQDFSVDSKDLSTIIFSFGDKQLTFLKGFIVGNKFYGLGIDKDAKSNILFVADASSLDNERVIVDYGVTLEEHSAVAGSTVQNSATLKDMRISDGYLVIEANYTKTSDSSNYPCAYFLDLSIRDLDNIENNFIKIEGKSSVYGDTPTEMPVFNYAFPIPVNDDTYIGLYDGSNNKQPSITIMKKTTSTVPGATGAISAKPSYEKSHVLKIIQDYENNSFAQTSKILHCFDKGDLLLFGANYTARIKNIATVCASKQEQSVNASAFLTLTSSPKIPGEDYFQTKGLVNGLTDSDGYDFTALCGYKENNKYYAFYKEYGLFVFDINAKDSAPVFEESYLMFNLANAYVHGKKAIMFEEIYFIPQDDASGEATKFYAMKDYSLNLINPKKWKNGKVSAPSFVYYPMGSASLDIIEYNNKLNVDNYTVQLKGEYKLGSTTDETKSDKWEIRLTKADSPDYSFFATHSWTEPRSYENMLIYTMQSSYDGWDDSESVATGWYEPAK